MPANTTYDPVDLLPPLEAEGWPSKDCSWDNAPCVEAASYFVSYTCPEHGRAHAGDTRLFCPRHYALSLLHAVEVAAPLANCGFDDVVLEHGAV